MLKILDDCANSEGFSKYKKNRIPPPVLIGLMVQDIFQQILTCISSNNLQSLLKYLEGFFDTTNLMGQNTFSNT